MATRRVGRLVVGVHDAKPPTDAEWERWIAICRDEPGQLRVLVETHGGGPDAKQRKALSDALSDRDLDSAILTNSLVVRGVVTALAWLGIALRAFPMADLKGAADYLGLDSEERALCEQMLRTLRAECGVSGTRAAS